MRIIVFFDLPTESPQNLKDYRHFRKHLIKSGFIMMQKSVYCKLSQNDVAANSVIDGLKKHKPPDGVVQVLKVTEKQFTKMEFIVGDKKSQTLDSTERLVIL